MYIKAYIYTYNMNVHICALAVLNFVLHYNSFKLYLADGCVPGERTKDNK